MKDVLQYLLQYIVDHPDEVEIEEIEEDDRIILEIQAHPDDMGRIIGKNGRIIKALRDLTKIQATKQDVYVDVELIETT